MTAIKLPNLTTMLAKREEELGTTDRFEWAATPDHTFSILDPRVMTDEQRDELAILRRDLNEGLLLPSEFGEAFLDMYLGDQVEDFLEVGGTPEILTELISAYVEQMDPTRRSSRNTRPRSKRR